MRAAGLFNTPRRAFERAGGAATSAVLASDAAARRDGVGDAALESLDGVAGGRKDAGDGEGDADCLPARRLRF
eukprot:9633967-Karenia_brevis.AAC.1